MANVVCGIFNDSEAAGYAVGLLKEKGLTDSISVVTKDADTGKVQARNVSQDVTDGTLAGAGTGAIVGAVAGILAGAASFVVPGAGLIVLGPLATTLSGAAAGAVGGGVVGALVDLGIPEDQAKWYQHAVQAGQVLVSVAVQDDNEAEVMNILATNGGKTAEVGKT